MAANEQLRQAREDVAARDAELQELRERVADLEKLQKQQQSLIAMKDSDLAAAQQRLAEAAKKEPAASASWAWLGLVLLALAGAGWWWSRRRKPSPLPPAPRAANAGSGFAVDMPEPEYGDVQAAADEAYREMDEAVRAVEQDAAPYWSQPAPLPQAEPQPEPAEPTPLFEVLRKQPAVAETEPVATQEASLADSMASVAPLNPAPAGRERLELAIAYLDLGDAETARTLLNEVVTGADPQARNEAMELLARLG